jgi:hypothetical protein
MADRHQRDAGKPQADHDIGWHQKEAQKPRQLKEHDTAKELALLPRPTFTVDGRSKLEILSDGE